MNKVFFTISFFFLVISGFAQQADTLKTDTLKFNSLDLVLIKQNNHIINKDGKEKFYEVWMYQDWSEKNDIVKVLHLHPHFFDGFSSDEIEDLFGQPDNYGRYLAKKPRGQNDFCWIQFVFREDQVVSLLFPCS